VKRVLITGMSGVGKSSVIARLAGLGYKAVDADYGGYSELLDADAADRERFGEAKEWRWREDRITALLDDEDADVLFVSGTSSNQSKFYPRFDRIVLLTAPDAVMAERMRTRTDNPYGKDPSDVTRQLALKRIVEPWLRRAAHAVIDTSAPIDHVVDEIRRLVSEANSPR
jgi:dephospho-CoA kinase